MSKSLRLTLTLLLLLAGKSFSQDFFLSTPLLEFDGNRLLVTYDLISTNMNDEFFVWVEIVNARNEPIAAKTLSGQLGSHVAAGKARQIAWVPSEDAVFIDEEIFVEVKAEKYTKQFNKGGALAASTILPGLGQTKISGGKPWWITGLASYGALAGGFITHNKYLSYYDQYKTEADIVSRNNYLILATNMSKISNGLFISAAVLWTANLVWVAVAPNSYQPLKHVPSNLQTGLTTVNGTTVFALKINF
jgi:hypothetical protein